MLKEINSAVANVETGLTTSDVVCFTVTKALTERIVTLNVRRTVRNRKGKAKNRKKDKNAISARQILETTKHEFSK